MRTRELREAEQSRQRHERAYAKKAAELDAMLAAVKEKEHVDPSQMNQDYAARKAERDAERQQVGGSVSICVTCFTEGDCAGSGSYSFFLFVFCPLLRSLGRLHFRDGARRVCATARFQRADVFLVLRARNFLLSLLYSAVRTLGKCWRC